MTERRTLSIGIHYEYPFGGMARRSEWLPQGPADYRRDLLMIKDTGFDSIRIRIGLDSHLDDVASLLDICDELGLRVLYGFATFYVHNDFLEEFPDAKSIDRHGVTYPLHPHDYRWQRCCINHPEYRKRRAQLLTDSAVRFGDHPAVGDWDVHNEPSLGPGECPCYNPHSLQIYRAYCEKTYTDISGLNEAFGLAFNDFDDVEPPRVPNEAPASYWRFWREFMSQNLTDFLMEGVDIIRRTVPQANVSFNFTYPWKPDRSGQDWWVVDQLGYASTSLYRGSDERTASWAGSSLSLLKAMAGPKETWVTEFQGGPFKQEFLWRGPQLEAEIHQVFSHAIDALYLYRWEPLLAGAEPWINGLTDVDNYDTERRLRVKEVIANLRPHEHIVARGHNVKARVGIHVSRECIWTSSLQDVPTSDITTGQYGLFLDLGYEVTFLTETLTSDIDVELLCIPYMPAITKDEWDALQAFMESGGKVIAELPMTSLEQCQEAGGQLGLECKEWIEPIYFIAGWSLEDTDRKFCGFAFHDRVLLKGFAGEPRAYYQDNGEPALIQGGPKGNLLIPTFAMGRSYWSSFHHGLRHLLKSWLPDSLEPDISVQGVPAEYRTLMEARLVESDEGNLLFTINRSGFDWEVTVQPRGYEAVTLQLPHYGAMYSLVQPQ